jgi:uncharacterized protein (DUF427 family)
VSQPPAPLVPAGHVEAAPRRVRATIGAHTVFDTTDALYVWEWSGYPQYYVPARDVSPDVLVDEDETEHTPQGKVAVHGISVGDGDAYRPAAAKIVVASPVPELVETIRFDWSALDAWFEEDEQVYVHPRNPYTRVDVLRSTRTVRIELHGEVLAESSSPVFLFEAGLPTRYYLNRTEVDFAHLVPSDTVTSCPYKGTTTGYWSARSGERTHPDVAWTYEAPHREVQPIAGLIAFYNEKVDIFVDDVLQERPRIPRR